MADTLDILKRRWACKSYDGRMPEEDKIMRILDAGRLTPSSFGLEPWTFHVVRSSDILSECFYQESMKSAPVTIVITAKRGRFFDPDSDFIKERASRFPGTLEDFIEDFRGYYQMLKDKDALDSWSKAQCYLAAMSMMIAASEMDIESCAIEGFDNDRLLKALGVSGEDETAAIVIAFGYAAEAPREKIRESIPSVTRFHF